jgi:transmembrane 9 superfamily member 2/4
MTFQNIVRRITARLLKTFQCAEWSRALALTAFGFPGFALVSLSVAKIMGSTSYSSASAVLLVPILMSLVMIGVASLIILLGASIGYHQDKTYFPAATHGIPRPIPKQPWYICRPFTMALGGYIVFGGMYVELHFLMASLWKESYFYTFGFLLVAMMVTILNIVTLSFAFTFFRLQREDYHWWWRSFFDGGSVAMFVIIYAFTYMQQLPVNSFSSRVVYFGYLCVSSIVMFLMTGFVGLATSLWFNLTLYSVKRNPP